jgi:transketolase
MSNTIEFAKLLRYFILTSTTIAGSGHPTSSLSAVEFMSVLFGEKYFVSNLDNPKGRNNDRLIFSKGHAAPLLYSVYAALGKLSQNDLNTLRKFGSRIEGHPTMDFEFTEVPTGSLGQGIGVAVGYALAQKKLEVENGRLAKTWVLLGDGELAEGSVWESANCAANYGLSNLVALVDLNRLGQTKQTQHGHHSEIIANKFRAFGWNVIEIEDGNSLEQVSDGFKQLSLSETKPTVIIAKTKKGAGISFLQDQLNWHGKALSQDQLTPALGELGAVDLAQVGSFTLEKPEALHPLAVSVQRPDELDYTIRESYSMRESYGKALARLGNSFSNPIVVCDAETSNSTFTYLFEQEFPERFFEMYIAEQNMVSVATGLSRFGFTPFASTFAAFFTRAFDQVRMLGYSRAHVNLVGSHVGVSIGADGASQMALEDMAMFRSVEGSVVLYPSDSVSVEKCVELMARREGLNYMRLTRADLPVRYSSDEVFEIGGSKTLVSSEKDICTIFAAGITVGEALTASSYFESLGVGVRVVDLYSVKPLDVSVVQKSCKETHMILVMEDHHKEGGLYSAVLETGLVTIPTYSLSVRKTPHSGTAKELLEYEEIDSSAAINLIKKHFKLDV